jgi:hypothetical protein
MRSKGGRPNKFGSEEVHPLGFIQVDRVHKKESLTDEVSECTTPCF